MKDKLNLLKSRVKTLSKNKEFIHHKWFIKWHLEIVEKISLELCEIYTCADKDIVITLVWLHDYAKILDSDREHDHEIMDKAKDLLKELSFDTDFISKVLDYMYIFEDKMTKDLHKTPIEVQIVSSSDAASHMVGPFYPLYWYENPDMSVESLLEANKAKLIKDWERKITLPEVRKSFQRHYEFIECMSGKLPKRFLAG